MDYKTSVCDHKRWEHQQWARIILYSVSRIVYLIILGTVWIVSLLQLAKITNTLSFLFVTSGFWIGLNVFFFVNTELKKTRQTFSRFLFLNDRTQRTTDNWVKDNTSVLGWVWESVVGLNKFQRFSYIVWLFWFCRFINCGCLSYVF